MDKDESGVIGEQVTIEEGAIVYSNAHILGNSKICSGAIVYPNSIIENSTIGENSIVMCSVVENSTIGKNVKIGPFAHIRPNSVIEDDCKIGNFVEIKNSKVSRGTKVSHLAYVGDAFVGENCNIGCGVIFVNYNGKIKQKIMVGNNCFVGSNCNLVAPVCIADDTYVCAGTTVTTNTNKGDFVIGRVRETVKKDRAYFYLKEKD
jgi:bifunctional UDP-N-acetylglucosamine pyrophosphorylase/glucosamine-1-phosphate N-acetyltransferase